MAHLQLWRKDICGSFRFSILFYGMLIFLGLSVLLLRLLSADRKSISPTVSRHIQYNFTLQNKTNRTQENTVFCSYAPIEEGVSQGPPNLSASQPYQLSFDPMGNRIMQFHFDEIPPFSTKMIRIESKLLVNDRRSSPEQNELKENLKPAPGIESDDLSVQSLAKQLTMGNPLSTTRNIYAWVESNIRYTGYRSESLGARYALETRSGDCTEYAYLFVALCRANGIPARPVGGYVCKENRHLHSADYHNWAEVLVEGVWRIVDPQGKRFMEDETDYVAFCRMGGLDETIGAGSQRYRISGNGIRVKMN